MSVMALVAAVAAAAVAALLVPQVMVSGEGKGIRRASRMCDTVSENRRADELSIVTASNDFTTVHSLKILMNHRVSHLVIDLGLVDLDLSVPPFCPAARPLLPNSHQLRQS